MNKRQNKSSAWGTIDFSSRSINVLSLNIGVLEARFIFRQEKKAIQWGNVDFCILEHPLSAIVSNRLVNDINWDMPLAHPQLNWTQIIEVKI